MIGHNESGDLTLFGFHVVGGWLPWFGWREEEMCAFDADRFGFGWGDVIVDALTIEWLGMGFMFCAKVKEYL